MHNVLSHTDFIFGRLCDKRRRENNFFDSENCTNDFQNKKNDLTVTLPYLCSLYSLLT